MFSRIEDRANLPAVLHCTAGKDRTGWASAAILTMLGVPKSTVMQDYLLSNELLKAKYGTFDTYLAKGVGVGTAARAKLEQELLAG